MLRIQREGVEENFGTTLKYKGDSLIKRGKDKEGHIHMMIGLHDDNYKKELTIDITDESLREAGDFANIDLTKEEVKKLIDFLNKRYKEMEKYDSKAVQTKAVRAYVEMGIDESEAKFIASLTNVRKVAKLKPSDIDSDGGYEGVWLKQDVWEKCIQGAKKYINKF